MKAPDWFPGTQQEYEYMRARSAAERKAQGLPPTIQDPAVYEHLAHLIKASSKRKEAAA